MTVVLGKRTRSQFTVVVPSPARSGTSKRRNTAKTTTTTIFQREAEDDDDGMADAIVVRSESPAPTPVLEPRTPRRSRRTAAPPATATPSATATATTPTSAAGGVATGRQPLSPQKSNTVVLAAAEPTKETLPKTPRHRDSLTKPLTPRHRDSLTKPLTPRHRDSPSKPHTPRHRVSVISRPLTPRSKPPATPPHAAPPSTVLTAAKTLFARSSAGGPLVGRDTERATLAAFLHARLDARRGGCLYVSGPPGCGKTALVTEALAGAGLDGPGIRTAWINCMALHTPAAIYAALLDAFACPGSALADLEALVAGAAGAAAADDDDALFVLVLDEIDQLRAHEHLLPALLTLALRRDSRLVLVGIANALDLADRLLPQLPAQAQGSTPQRLPVRPYTASQIAAVVTARLRSLLAPADVATQPAAEPSFVPCVHPAAVQLLARKVAAASGDLRQAFDILRRALELVEAESLHALRVPAATAVAAARPVLGETTPNNTSNSPNLSNSPKSPKSPKSPNPPAPTWTALTAPRATLAHVAKAASAALGASMGARIAALNGHQKALLCVLVARQSDSVGSTPLRALREAYAAACRRELVRMMPLVGAEFRAVVDAMEATGVLDIRAGECVVSRVGRAELLAAVSADGVRGRDGLMAILAQS